MRLVLSTLVSNKRRLFGKNLRASDLPFNFAMEANIDFCFYVAQFKINCPVSLEVGCCLRKAQCACWECYEELLGSCIISDTLDNLSSEGTTFAKQLSTDNIGLGQPFVDSNIFVVY